MAHDVFVSYAKGDQALADSVCATLEEAGIRCWIATRDIVPGQHWSGAIIRAIAASRVMVLVFSERANASTQILREVERAADYRVHIVPFRIEETDPSDDLAYFISAQHWLDAFNPPLDAHLRRLSNSVRRILDESGAPASGTRSGASRGGIAEAPPLRSEAVSEPPPTMIGAPGAASSPPYSGRIDSDPAGPPASGPDADAAPVLHADAEREEIAGRAENEPPAGTPPRADSDPEPGRAGITRPGCGRARRPYPAGSFRAFHGRRPARLPRLHP